MIVLGLACSFSHDPSAALLVDGRVVAAAEQERFSRRKHGPGETPLDAARFCLERAGVRAGEVDLVACAWSPEAVRTQRWSYLRRNWARLPRKAVRMLYAGPRRERRRLAKVHEVMRVLGVRGEVPLDCVEHHLAHASSAYHFSGFDASAIATIDGMGEITTTMFARGEGGVITKLHEIPKPDSLGMFYASITDYLGFEVNDGEYKVMGMAGYGDPARVDLSGLVRFDAGDLRIDLDFVHSPPDMRYQGRAFGQRLVERLGPPRADEEAREPYVHVAAAAQALFERASLALIEHHLRPVLERTRRLCFAGGCALNVALNRRLIEHPLIDELFVPPGAGDSGTSLGAASYAAASRGERIEPLEHAYHGPSFSDEEIARELDGLRVPWQRVPDAPAAAAELLARGEVVAWFQGPMEWGPRALGNRSILGHPGVAGTAEDINRRIKYREPWRPFCPSVLEEFAAEVLGSKHPSPFMTYSFRVAPAWRARLPEVVHVDGTLRPQVVSARTNPRFHRLIAEFQRRTGLPCVINTSLNRRGEPLVCRPPDALAMFYGSGLEHLFLGDAYVAKRPGS